MDNMIDLTGMQMEKQLEQLRNDIRKPNILVSGATGSGKSSLINEIFGVNVAQTGHSRPLTRGISRYAREDLSVVLYDSEGYEIGHENLSHFRQDILGYVDLMRKEFPNDYSMQIHMVWYCISAAAKRITDLDLALLRELRQRNIPVCVVFTKIDAVGQSDLISLRTILHNELPDMESFCFSAAEDPAVREAVTPYVQRDELVAYTVEQLPDVLKEGLIRACVGALQQKRAHINKHIIPFYISSACAAVVVPVPFSDSAILAPIQMTMTTRIMSIYGIDKIKGAVSSILETTIVSQIGKSLSASILGNIAKCIPGVGTGVGTAVNAAVASSVTTILGYAMSELCYQYTRDLLRNGKADINRYFNTASIQKAIGFFMNQKKKQLEQPEQKQLKN